MREPRHESPDRGDRGPTLAHRPDVARDRGVVVVEAAGGAQVVSGFGHREGDDRRRRSGQQFEESAVCRRRVRFGDAAHDVEPVAVRTALDQLDLADIPSSKGLYAPTIRHHDGVFHVVCTVVAPMVDGVPTWPGRAGHFLVTATDPAGPWSDPIWFDGFDGIDPSLTFDGDRVWLCGNRLAQPGLWPGQTDIWLTELDPATFAPIGEVNWIWRGAMATAVWAEGPHIIAHPDGGWPRAAPTATTRCASRTPTRSPDPTWVTPATRA